MSASGFEFEVFSGINYHGSQAVNTRLQQITGTGDFENMANGMIAWNTSVTRIQGVLSSALKTVPFIQENDTISGAWTFDRGAATPPFIVTRDITSVGDVTTMVSKLNANYLKGYLPDAAANASTVVLRDASGRMKAATPSATDDVATKQWSLDTIYGIISSKIEARGRATGNVDIASAPAAGAAVWDGLTLVNGDRVFLKDQSTGSQNGLWIWNGVGVAMTRATDADTDEEVNPGMSFFVSEGTLWGNSRWQLTTDEPLTLGTTALTFSQIGGASDITEGNGIGKTGNSLWVKINGGDTYIAGGFLYGGSASTLSMTAALTGIIKGNGTGAPTAILPGTTASMTSGTIPKMSSASPYLVDSIITEAASVITVTGGLTVTGTSTLATSLTGMLKGAAGVVSAVTGETNRVTFWSDANTISSDANLSWASTVLNIRAATPNTTNAAFIVKGKTQYDYLVLEAFGSTKQWSLGNVNTNDFAVGETGVDFRMTFLAGGGVIVGGTTALASGILQVVGGLTFSGAQTIATTTGALTISTGSAAAMNFNINSANAWSILSTGVLQAAAAQSITTAAGALTLAPFAGSSLIVTTSGASGDFIVNTNMLVVDSSTGYVGVGIALPAYNFQVVGSLASKGSSSVGLHLFDRSDVNNDTKQFVLYNDSGYVRFYTSASGGDKLVINTTTGNVGINTPVPGSLLHVLGGGTAVAAVSGVQAWFQSSASSATSSYVGIVSGTAGAAGLLLGDTADQDIGMVWYDNALDKMYLRTNNADRLSISSTGVVNIAALSVSSLVQTNGSLDLISSNALPDATTIGGFNIARGYYTTITGAGLTKTITHSLGTKKLIAFYRNQTTGAYGMSGFKAVDSGGSASDNDITMYFDYALGLTVLEVTILAIN